MTKRTLLGAAALALPAIVATLLVGPPADATSYACPADVAGGVAGDYDTCGDVRRLGGDIVVFHADRGIRGQREVVAGVATTAMPDPARGLAWQGTDTRIEIYWDTDRSRPSRSAEDRRTRPDLNSGGDCCLMKLTRQQP